jgi:hypothetical protein
MDQTKKILKKLILFVPILGFMVIVNAVLDPAHLYLNDKNYGFEKGIAEILASGHNVANVHNFDHRMVQKFRIAKENGLPDIAIIGSSRSMQIGTNIFPDKHVLNNSVPGGSLSDYLGILFNYEKKGGFPKTIIFCIDPWVLNPKNDDTGWISIKGDTFAMLKELGISPGRYFKTPLISPRMTNLFSFSYFQTALETFFKERALGDTYFSTDKEIGDDYDIELKDGRRSYSKKFRNRSEKEVEREALNKSNTSIGENYDFQKPDRDLSKILGKLVSYLQSKHVDIVFYLAPYHPAVYNTLFLPAQKKTVIGIENYYRDFAKMHKLKILGSYDPAKAGLTEKDFYDGIHASKEGVEKIFR